jgi:acyl-ACP thioesterase
MINMEIWTETTTVKTYETDLNRRWKPACFFQAMQQAATHHAASWGYDYDALLKAGRVWILSRLKIRFECFPADEETVSIRTWPKGIGQKLFFLRDFEFHTAGGQPLAAATSAWVLIDPSARRMLLPNALDFAVPHNEGLSALNEPLDKIAAPDDLPERLTVQAGYSAVDMLGHANNARYVEWACDSLPLDLHRDGRLRALQVNFLNEVRPGERVSLRAGEQDGIWLVYGQNLDRDVRAFESAAVFVYE